MKVYKHSKTDTLSPRAHPWTVSLTNFNHRYYNFKKNPELIRTSLEDFLRFAEEPFVEQFYRLLEWLNGSESIFESNDCATSEPTTNNNENFPKALQINARLMILFRELSLNLSLQNSQWLEDAIHFYLNKIDSDFEFSVIGTSIFPVTYIGLDNQDGYQIVLNFWAWGNNKEEVMNNLGQSFVNAKEALMEVCHDVQNPN